MTNNDKNLRWPKAFASLAMAPDEKVLWQGRPLWVSNWVMIMGFILGLVIPFREQGTDVHPFFWLLMAGVFASIAWNRRRQFYLLTSQRLIKSNQFGPGRLQVMALKNVKRAAPRRGLTGTISRTGHVFVDSWAPGEAALDLLGQAKAEELAALIQKTAAAAGAELEI